MNRTGLVGMSVKEMRQWSLTRALQPQIGGKPLEGIELEMHQECARTSTQQAEGVWVPHDLIFSRAHGQRDLQVGVFGQGGALVETQIPSTPVELLRNRAVVERMGATPMNGLHGNVALSRQTSAMAVGSLPETDTSPSTNLTVDQILLAPHRLGGQTTVGKQLILQSSPDVETLIFTDIRKVVNLKIDYLALHGSGSADEPTGVMNVPGIGSVTFAGAATFAKIVAFETSLSQMNADQGKLGWVTSPAVKGAWKTTAVALVGAQTVSSRSLWTDLNDGSPDGVVNGQRAAATNQMPNDQVLYGNFSDLIIATWNTGTDLVVNPYSLDTSGEVRVTINLYFDIAVRHPQSFCLSADSGAQ